MTTDTRASETAATSRATVTAVVVPIATVLGALIALQSRVNGTLGRRISDGYLAAVISFGSGLVVLSIALIVAPAGRRGWRALVATWREHTVPRWYFIGGACGSVLVLSQGVTAAVLGVALFTVSVVAGQTLSALVVDRRGLGTMRAKPITWPRIAGSVVMVVAVVVAVSGQLGTTTGLALMIMPLIAGLLTSFQQAINGQVRQTTGSALAATWNNFALGTLVLIIAFVVHGIARGWPHRLPTEPYLYVGGLLGIAFIGGTSILVRHVGVLVLGLCTIAGQLIGSLVLDLVLPVAGHVIGWGTVLGTVLALLAIGITAIRPRRTPAEPAGR